MLCGQKNLLRALGKNFVPIHQPKYPSFSDYNTIPNLKFRPLCINKCDEEFEKLFKFQQLSKQPTKVQIPQVLKVNDN